MFLNIKNLPMDGGAKPKKISARVHNLNLSTNRLHLSTICLQTGLSFCKQTSSTVLLVYGKCADKLNLGEGVVAPLLQLCPCMDACSMLSSAIGHFVHMKVKVYLSTWYTPPS